MDRPFIFFDPTVIRKLRKTKQLTLSGLGRMLDVGANTISSWEDGRSKIPASELAVLANVLGVEVSVFFKKRTIERKILK